MTIILNPAAQYARVRRRRILLLALITAVFFATAVADLLVGPALLPLADVLTALLPVSDGAELTVDVIVWDIRLPMTTMAMVVGASLGVAGALMQTILGNPLASPYTLGFSAAAGFGAALVILLGVDIPALPGLAVPIAAFLAAAGATALVYGLARRRDSSAEVMILSGIATLFLFQSAQSLVQYMAAPEVLQEIVFWLFGSLLKATWLSVSVAGVILVVSAMILLPDIWRLTALRLGDERARSLGVDVEALRRRIFVIVALLTAGAVAFVGTIGFVGLVAPHIARALVGDDQRFLLPVSAVTGAMVMVAASVVSKTLSPGAVVPIGIVTAIVGVPFLFALILRGRRSYW